MKSPRKMAVNNSKPNKSEKEEKGKKKKEQIESKNKEKEDQFKKLEDYVNETGLSLAFNIIFAELISKQIMPENFFAYTSMRLKQIGKEIEGLKAKEEIKEDKIEEQEDNKEINNIENNAENNENDNKLFQPNNKEDDKVLLTIQQPKKNKK